MKLYIRNLPSAAAESDLEALCSPYGEVIACVVMRNNRTGQSRRFAFVTMDDEDARKTMKALDGEEYGGQTLKVSEARDS